MTMRSIPGNAWLPAAWTASSRAIFPWEPSRKSSPAIRFDANLLERIAGLDFRDGSHGKIAEIKPGNPFKQIRVKPAANLERLEEVLVLLTLHPLEMKNEERPANAQPSAPGATSPPRAARR